MKYQYSQEAKERIAALGPTQISNFIDEIPAKLREAAYRKVAPIKGFRPKSSVEFKAKQKRLVGQLAKAGPGKPGGSEWDFFATLWDSNCRHRFGAGFPPASLANNAEAGETFLDYLVAHCADVSREEAEHIHLFGPFPDPKERVASFARFRSAAELERARMLETLSAKVETIGVELGGLKAEIGETAARMEQVVARAAEAGAEAQAVGNKALATSAAVEALRSDLGRALATLDDRERQPRPKADLGLADKVAGLAEDLAALSRRETDWARMTSDLADLSQRVAELSYAVDELPRRQGEPQDLAEVLERIRSVEHLLARTDPAHTPGVRLLETSCDGEPREIFNVADAVEIASSNMWAAGLVRGDADRCAREVVAALVCGQVVQFAGSLADFLADACAAAIGGRAFHEWRVPVGLTSEEAAAKCLEFAAERSFSCLLLKGANLSAFEVYGPAIRELVVRRQFGTDLSGPALMATWSQGPVAFPEGGTLAELGPVLNTDMMRWRSTAPMKALVFGSLGCATWAALEGIETDPEFSADELTAMLDRYPFPHGRLWSRVSARAYRTLRGIPGGSEVGDLRSVMMSWTLPWARAIDGPVKDITRLIANEPGWADTHPGALAEA